MLKEGKIRVKRIYQFLNSFINHQIENNNNILKEKDDGILSYFPLKISQIEISFFG